MDYNVIIKRKSNTGYDILNPKTEGDVVKFDRSGSDLISTNMNEVVKESRRKSIDDYKNINRIIGSLINLTTNAKDNIVSAINELKDNFKSYILKSDIVNNLTSTNIDKPLSANMGKQLNDDMVKVKILTREVVPSDDAKYGFERFSELKEPNVLAVIPLDVSANKNAVVKMNTWLQSNDIIRWESLNWYSGAGSFTMKIVVLYKGVD